MSCRTGDELQTLTILNGLRPSARSGDAMRTHAGVQLKIHLGWCDEIWRLGVGYRMFSRTVPQGSSSCACALNDRARNNFRDFQSRAKEM